MNSLGEGKCRQRTGFRQTATRQPSKEVKLLPGHTQLHMHALRESQRLSRERRSGGLHCLTGAQSVSKLLKLDAVTRYGADFVKATKHLAMDPNLIDEPAHERVVPMLAALSPEESLYYGAEQNVVDLEAKSETIFH